MCVPKADVFRVWVCDKGLKGRGHQKLVFNLAVNTSQILTALPDKDKKHQKQGLISIFIVFVSLQTILYIC